MGNFFFLKESEWNRKGKQATEESMHQYSNQKVLTHIWFSNKCKPNEKMPILMYWTNKKWFFRCRGLNPDSINRFIGITNVQ